MHLRRLIVALFVLWVLVVTNPHERSFHRYLADQRHLQQQTTSTSTSTTLREICNDHDNLKICVSTRHAFALLNSALKSVFAPHRVTPPYANASLLRFEVLDCALFTIIRSRPSLASTPHRLFIGLLGLWLPVPTYTSYITIAQLRRLFRNLRNTIRNTTPTLFKDAFRDIDADASTFESFRESVLPNRPWEWLLALFFIVGAVWFLFPQQANSHLTLTWENVRHNGNWWCMVFFHLSHGGSLLRLVRTIVSINYLAPQLVRRGIVTLSGFYGVVLTGSALSTALGMLVLARRYVYGTRSSQPRTALEINGGGGCIYALLVAACLSPTGCRMLSGGVRPFELLMINVAFDAFFLAGQKRIADYTAHAGAALGAWLFCAMSDLR